jgi:hypothetical protein
MQLSNLSTSFFSAVCPLMADFVVKVGQSLVGSGAPSTE